MSSSPTRVTHLRELTTSVDGDDAHSLQVALTALVSQLGVTVGSYRGLQLTVVDHGSSVTLTEFTTDSTPPATSLRVSLALIMTAADRDSRVGFYAATPGALVDLAADLSYSVGLATTTHRPVPGGGPRAANNARPVIELDGDLPPPSLISGLVGVAELSSINRAVGFLIGQGQLPEDAHDTIRRGAAAAEIDVHLFAARLLRR